MAPHVLATAAGRAALSARRGRPGLSAQALAAQALSAQALAAEVLSASYPGRYASCRTNFGLSLANSTGGPGIYHER